MSVAKVLWLAALFALILLSGFWVARLGRPLNTAVFTVHKLLALACLVMFVVVIRAASVSSSMGFMAIALTALTFALFASMFATGVFLSLERPAPGFVLLLHRVVPVIMIASSAGALYLIK
ncbi:MAG TPA: hypothetical protein P5511_08340 [Candidatus Goldiibacteriota bacterium]|nr:hypothetical protein [Candidatus Goldiibacteriota bacterium]